MFVSSSRVTFLFRSSTLIIMKSCQVCAVCCEKKLIKRTIESFFRRESECYFFLRDEKGRRDRERSIYKSHPFSWINACRTCYGTYYWSLKSAEKERAVATCYRSFPSSLRRASGVRWDVVSKKIQKKIALRKLQAPQVAKHIFDRFPNIAYARVCILYNFQSIEVQ